jgi:hypothetical protein
VRMTGLGARFYSIGDTELDVCERWRGSEKATDDGICLAWRQECFCKLLIMRYLSDFQVGAAVLSRGLGLTKPLCAGHPTK